MGGGAGIVHLFYYESKCKKKIEGRRGESGGRGGAAGRGG